MQNFSTIQFRVGDAGTIPVSGDSYTNENLVGKSIIVCVDGKSISQGIQLIDRMSCAYNKSLGKISFSARLAAGQLIQILY